MCIFARRYGTFHEYNEMIEHISYITYRKYRIYLVNVFVSMKVMTILSTNT